MSIFYTRNFMLFCNPLLCARTVHVSTVLCVGTHHHYILSLFMYIFTMHQPQYINNYLYYVCCFSLSQMLIFTMKPPKSLWKLLINLLAIFHQVSVGFFHFPRLLIAQESFIIFSTDNVHRMIAITIL